MIHEYMMSQWVDLRFLNTFAGFARGNKISIGF